MRASIRDERRAKAKAAKTPAEDLSEIIELAKKSGVNIGTGRKVVVLPSPVYAPRKGRRR